VNPFHYQFLTAAGNTRVRDARGALMDYQHERDHHSGCLGGGAGCVIVTGSMTRTEPAEAATTADIDGVARALGLPERGDYAGSSFSSGGNDPSGGVARMPGGTMTAGSNDQLVHGR